jgi:hypothetical protein
MNLPALYCFVAHGSQFASFSFHFAFVLRRRWSHNRLGHVASVSARRNGNETKSPSILKLEKKTRANELIKIAPKVAL